MDDSARRTVVGVHQDGDALWVVAEQGRHAAYVRNLEANPAVRIRLGRRWRAATAYVLDEDDAVARLATFGRDGHAKTVTSMGTSLLTLRFELSA
jgi:deazaflavin-dependent oxidoreductase (nitroreductase family)